MTTKLTTVKLADGKELLVEIDEPPTVGVRSVGIGDKGEVDFNSALETVKSAANQLQGALLSLAVKPESCEIAFGIKLSASAGVILAKAGTEANFSIKLNWKKT